jgi:hypothetical protein
MLKAAVKFHNKVKTLQIRISYKILPFAHSNAKQKNTQQLKMNVYTIHHNKCQNIKEFCPRNKGKILIMNECNLRAKGTSVSTVNCTAIIHKKLNKPEECLKIIYLRCTVRHILHHGCVNIQRELNVVASFLKDSLHNTVPTSTGTFKLCNKK